MFDAVPILSPHSCALYGSTSALRLSPNRSNKKTIMTNVRPGKKANHHIPEDKYFMLSDKIIPIAGCSGERPYPRKVIEASCNMA